VTFTDCPSKETGRCPEEEKRNSVQTRKAARKELETRIISLFHVCSHHGM